MVRASSFLAACLGLVVSAAGAAPPVYRITPIPTLGGPLAWGQAINAAGEVVGFSWMDISGRFEAFRFSGGISTAVTQLNSTSGSAGGINRHGQIVGSFGGGSSVGAFQYSNGVVSMLPIPPNDNAHATAINDRGQIAGRFTLPGGSTRAFVLVNGVFKDLVGLESWGGSEASGINNKGEVVGSSYIGGGFGLKAFLYSGGPLKAIGYVGPFLTQGFALNDVGQVVGNTTTPPDGNTGQHAYVWSEAKGMELLPAPAGSTSSVALSINNAGQVVGDVYGGAWSGPFIATDNAVYNLAALVINPLPGRTLSRAHAINDAGQIVVDACADSNPNYDCVAVRLDPYLPGAGTIMANPYGTMAVTGGALSNNVLTLTDANATIQLGTTNGGAASKAVIDFQGINVAPGIVLTIRSGAPNQTLVLNNAGLNATTISGSIRAVGGNGAPAPAIVLQNPRGIAIAAEGSITGPSGLTLDALATSSTGQGVLNFGVVDGGSSLVLAGSAINGAAVYKGNAIRLSTFGNVNNPVNGARYLSNSVQLAPSTGQSLALTLNGYGASPQVFNVKVNGNALVSMPSSWPAASVLVPNNIPVLPGSFRAAGIADPAYGGGSMIIQATGSLVLDGGTSRDFVFPGGIVLKAGVSIDHNGTAVVSGWTTNGQAWQGQYYEAPVIMSSAPPIDVWLSDLNWVNFNARPIAGVRAFQLRRQPNGSAQYATADTTAPHLNTYSTLVDAAANGECWICLVDSTPVDMTPP